MTQDSRHFPCREMLFGNTGYGVHWPDMGQGLSHSLDLAQKTGFKVIKQEDNGVWFYLELQK